MESKGHNEDGSEDSWENYKAESTAGTGIIFFCCGEETFPGCC